MLNICQHENQSLSALLDEATVCVLLRALEIPPGIKRTLRLELIEIGKPERSETDPRDHEGDPDKRSESD
ncbi:unnamed protein product [Protopolystoma xenopodis]|uniref:Uncharacterized protein n=1 Tax=Protopolystoma xenopodis TaxID=117903 RepID=A0A3S5FBK7_9PLAT|nr:unnamed protein product [Protopolystoma xenopodis]